MAIDNGHGGGDEPELLRIERIGAQGDGVALRGGLELHVPRALPGETVRQLDSDTFEHVGRTSPERRANALCPHVAACGGCQVQHMSENLYRGWKASLLAEALAHRGIDAPLAAMVSVPPASRRRATMTGRHGDHGFELGFHGARSHAIEVIAACAVLRPEIVGALPTIAEMAAVFCRPGQQVRVAILAADNGLDVTIESETTARRARHDLAGLARRAATAGIVRLTHNGQPILQLAAPVITIADVAIAPPPSAFLQAASETDVILGRLVSEGLGKARRVVDLFAGLGTMAFAAARRAKVLAVDSDAALLAALAEAHRGARGLKPIETRVRDLFRDPLSPRELVGVDAVIVDPPRAGARAQAEALARADVKRIVMVSCNPATLARDLRILVDSGYRVLSAQPVDQFLYSSHLEAVAVLAKA